MLSVQDLSKFFRVSDSTIYSAILKNSLLAYKIGDIWRIQKADVLEWLEKSKDSTDEFKKKQQEQKK